MCKAQKQKQKYDDDWYLIAQAKCKLLSYILVKVRWRVKSRVQKLLGKWVNIYIYIYKNTEKHLVACKKMQPI